MSAIRHERRGLRAMQASPYARPSKKSPWSLASLFSFLNVLGFRSSSDEPPASEPWSLPSSSKEAGETTRTAEPPSSDHQHDTTDKTHVDQATHPVGPPKDQRSKPSNTNSSPPKRSIVHLDDIDDSSPANNLEIVAKFLEERGGKPMSSVELEGVISLPQPKNRSHSVSPAVRLLRQAEKRLPMDLVRPATELRHVPREC